MSAGRSTDLLAARRRRRKLPASSSITRSPIWGPTASLVSTHGPAQLAVPVLLDQLTTLKSSAYVRGEAATALPPMYSTCDGRSSRTSNVTGAGSVFVIHRVYWMTWPGTAVPPALEVFTSTTPGAAWTGRIASPIPTASASATSTTTPNHVAFLMTGLLVRTGLRIGQNEAAALFAGLPGHARTRASVPRRFLQLSVFVSWKQAAGCHLLAHAPTALLAPKGVRPNRMMRKGPGVSDSPLRYVLYNRFLALVNNLVNLPAKVPLILPPGNLSATRRDGLPARGGARFLRVVCNFRTREPATHGLPPRGRVSSKVCWYLSLRGRGAPEAIAGGVGLLRFARNDTGQSAPTVHQHKMKPNQGAT